MHTRIHNTQIQKLHRVFTFSFVPTLSMLAIVSFNHFIHTHIYLHVYEFFVRWFTFLSAGFYFIHRCSCIFRSRAQTHSHRHRDTHTHSDEPILIQCGYLLFFYSIHTFIFVVLIAVVAVVAVTVVVLLLLLWLLSAFFHIIFVVYAFALRFGLRFFWWLYDLCFFIPANCV